MGRLLISPPPWRNISLRDVAARFSALGNDGQALATLDLIPEPAERAEGLAELASQEVDKHDPSAPLALELAYEAATLFELLPGIVDVG